MIARPYDPEGLTEATDTGLGFSHLAFVERLAGMTERDPAWRQTMAGFLTMRAVDVWREQPPAQGEQWRVGHPSSMTAGVVRAIGEIEARHAIRLTLYQVVEALGETSPAAPRPVLERLISYGRALEFDAEWALAIDVHQAVLEQAEWAGDGHCAGHAALRLGFGHRVRARHDAALGWYTVQADLDRALNDLAVNFVELGLLEAARDAYLVVLATAQEQATRCRAMVNLLAVVGRAGDPAAVERYRRELAEAATLEPLFTPRFAPVLPAAEGGVDTPGLLSAGRMMPKPATGEVVVIGGAVAEQDLAIHPDGRGGRRLPAGRGRTAEPVVTSTSARRQARSASRSLVPPENIVPSAPREPAAGAAAPGEMPGVDAAIGRASASAAVFRPVAGSLAGGAGPADDVAHRAVAPWAAIAAVPRVEAGPEITGHPSAQPAVRMEAAGDRYVIRHGRTGGGAGRAEAPTGRPGDADHTLSHPDPPRPAERVGALQHEPIGRGQADVGPAPVRVTIGRVEVRAVLPERPPDPAPVPAWQPPLLSLDEYLRGTGAR